VSRPTGANRIVLVNVSSDDNGLGDLESLTPADHPWIRYRSFIRSDMAMLGSVPQVQRGLAARVLLPQAPLAALTLTKLQRAVRSSRHTRLDIKSVLEEQGFG
jgi:hypothetical protein